MVRECEAASQTRRLCAACPLMPREHLLAPPPPSSALLHTPQPHCPPRTNECDEPDTWQRNSAVVLKAAWSAHEKKEARKAREAARAEANAKAKAKAKAGWGFF